MNERAQNTLLKTWRSASATTFLMVSANPDALLPTSAPAARACSSARSGEG